MVSIVEKSSTFLRCLYSRWASTFLTIAGITDTTRNAVDVEARSCWCTHGGHGAYAGSLRRRLHNPGHRCVRYASVRIFRIRRVCRPRLPN